MKEIKDIILNYIINKYDENTTDRKTHHSYCLFPEQDCTCKSLNNITYDTSLIQGGYIDSFSMVTILVYLENTFNIKILDIDAVPNNFESINTMVQLVEKYMIEKVIKKHTIVSNSCSSMYVYNYFFEQNKHPAFIDYTNPFISTWIPDDEQYVKFCENYDYYISIEPRFGEPINTKWSIEHNGNTRQTGHLPYYPVMFLDDIEIHWAHDRTNNDKKLQKDKLVLTKYNERLNTSMLYEPIFLWCYHEMYNTHTDEERKKLIQRFNNIERKTIFFTNIREEEQYNENTIVKFISLWEKSRKGDYIQKATGEMFKNEILYRF